jgi:hypothetical protein
VISTYSDTFLIRRLKIGLPRWRKECWTPDGLVIHHVDQKNGVLSYRIPPLLCGSHLDYKLSLEGSSTQSYDWPFEIPGYLFRSACLNDLESIENALLSWR